MNGWSPPGWKCKMCRAFFYEQELDFKKNLDQSRWTCQDRENNCCAVNNIGLFEVSDISSVGKCSRGKETNTTCSLWEDGNSSKNWPERKENRRTGCLPTTGESGKRLWYHDEKSQYTRQDKILTGGLITHLSCLALKSCSAKESWILYFSTFSQRLDNHDVDTFWFQCEWCNVVSLVSVWWKEKHAAGRASLWHQPREACSRKG